jgi:predicted nucleotidyltransferase
MRWREIVGETDWSAKAKINRDAARSARASGREADAKWWDDQANKAERVPTYRAELLEKERAFLARTVREILALVPDAAEIWLYGSRGTGVHKHTSDWDFLIFFRELSPSRALNLNARDGILAKVTRIGRRRVDLRAADIKSTNQFERVAREEGILLWQDQS